MTYRVTYSAAARRALTSTLSEKVATAAFEFIEGALADNPHRVGTQLRDPLFPLYSARRGEYRVVYEILDEDVRIDIVAVAHRRDVYRP